MIRSYLDGRMENTAFCLLAPDGKTRLSGSGRSPEQVLERRGGGDVKETMRGVAAKYAVKKDSSGAVVQDFHSFKQSLNVASADQRLLVFVVASEADRGAVRDRLGAVANDADVVGRFHFDFADAGDKDWAAKLAGDKERVGIFVVRSGEFGMDGEVIAKLPLDAKASEVKMVLLDSNKKFAGVEKRKVYSEHVKKGRRAGVKFENEMPQGEDRDGDGKVDERPRGGRGGR